MKEWELCSGQKTLGGHLCQQPEQPTEQVQTSLGLLWPAAVSLCNGLRATRAHNPQCLLLGCLHTHCPVPWDGKLLRKDHTLFVSLRLAVKTWGNLRQLCSFIHLTCMYYKLSHGASTNLRTGNTAKIPNIPQNLPSCSCYSRE